MAQPNNLQNCIHSCVDYFAARKTKRNLNKKAGKETFSRPTRYNGFFYLIDTGLSLLIGLIDIEIR